MRHGALCAKVAAWGGLSYRSRSAAQWPGRTERITRDRSGGGLLKWWRRWRMHNLPVIGERTVGMPEADRRADAAESGDALAAVPAFIHGLDFGALPEDVVAQAR